MIKICIMSTSLSNFGGEQRVVTQIANKMSEVSDFNISILFTSPYEKSNQFAYPLNSNIQCFWDEKVARRKHKYLLSKLYRRFYQKIYRMDNVKRATDLIISNTERNSYQTFFDAHDFDILIGVSPHSSAILGLIDVKSKKIGWLHSTFERYFETKNNYLWNQAPIYNYAMSKLDTLVVLTDAAKQRYSSEIGTEVKRIYNPLSFTSAIKSDLNSKNIIFVGRIDYDTKGLNNLILILKHLQNMIDKFKLVIVGDGKDMNRLRKDIELHNLTDVVDFIGMTENVAKYYTNSSICLVPSNIEGFGLVVIEAMECGLPVVSFETEGPSEIISNGYDGFLVSDFDTYVFAEKIAKLLMDEQLLTRMSENAKNRAKDFYIDEIGNQWVKLLKSDNIAKSLEN